MKALGKMAKCTKATANIIYQYFCWAFSSLFCQRISEGNWKIVKLSQDFIADVISTWISKAVFITFWEVLPASFGQMVEEVSLETCNSLGILVHDVINLLQYERWADKQNHFYIQYAALKIKILLVLVNWSLWHQSRQSSYPPRPSQDCLLPLTKMN